MRISGSDDYLGTYRVTEDWEVDGHTMRMRFCDRLLTGQSAEGYRYWLVQCGCRHLGCLLLG
jgi:hypothetical protein